MSKIYITVVLELPDDPDEARKIVRMFPFDNDFNGARVTALLVGDAIEMLDKQERGNG